MNPLARFLRRVLTHARAHAAAVSTGLSSVSALLVSVFVARQASVGEMGAFAIGFAGLFLVTGLTRAMVSEPLAAMFPDGPTLRRGGRQAAFWALLLGVLVMALGALAGNQYLVVAGAAAHGLCVGDHAKLSSIAFLRPRAAVLQELVRLVLFLGLLLVPDVRGAGWAVFAAWCAAGVLAGYGSAALSGTGVVPTASDSPVRRRVSLSYGVDHMLGTGTTQLSTFALGAWASPAVNAGFRGTGTLLGPATTFVTSGKALLIPFLSRRRAGQRRWGDVPLLATAMVLLAVPLLVLVNLIPPAWGGAILGESWPLAKGVLPVMSIEALLAMLSTIAFAGHRSEGAHRRTLVLRLGLSPVRLLLIVGGGVAGGLMLAAWATLLATAVSAAVWWTSYNDLLKRGGR